MNRPIAIVGAPSSIGIRPYDGGEVRHLDRAPVFCESCAGRLVTLLETLLR
jgi:hypothetical protein